MNKVYVVGLGPGAGSQMTGEAQAVLERCDVIIGYTVYVDLVRKQFPGKEFLTTPTVYVDLVRKQFPGKEFLTTPMKQEAKRCRMAFELARQGKRTAMICSGDAGVYGMAGLMYEVGREFPDTEVEIVAGITAAVGGAAVLGAPLTHDFAVISLSDLLTPWETIEKRVRAAAMADFVICLYNPSSRKRHDYLEKVCAMMLEYKSPDTVCGIVKQIGRDGESSRILTLAELKNTEVDMFTTVFIGNEQTMELDGHDGVYRKRTDNGA